MERSLLCPSACLLHYLGKRQEMKQFKYIGIWMIAVTLTLSSCELIGDIFQAGMAVGIFVVVLIVALVIWLLSRFRR